MSQAREKLEAFIRWVMRDVTYYKHYTATVQGQAGDLLDVTPDDSSLQAQGLSKVPIMYGLPGVSATVAPGTKVTLYFENGDPSKPRVCNWEGGHISLSFANGVLPAARTGDQVVVPGVLAGPATVVGTIIGGAPTVKL